MKRKLITWVAVLVLISVGFSVLTVNVSAEQDVPEPDNDKSIFFMEPNSTENYYYNYTSEIHADRNVLGDSEGWYGPDFYYDNQIQLTAHVKYVAGTETDNIIRVYVAAQGAYEYNETATPGNPDPGGVDWGIDYAGTTHVPIQAEIADIEGGDVSSSIEGLNTLGNTVSGDNMALGENKDREDRDLLMDTLKFGGTAIKEGVLDFKAPDGVSTVLGTLEAYDEYLNPHFKPDIEPHPEDEDNDFTEYPYDQKQKTWPLDYEDYGGEEDPDNERSYSAAAAFTMHVDNDEILDSLTLEFSARNILDIWFEDSTPSEYADTTEGPEASVEISIRNAEIEEVESDNKDSYGDSVSVTNRDGSLYWDDEISVLLNDQGWGYYLGFAYSPKVPEIDLSVNWDDGTEETLKENWEPYEWDVNIGGGYSVRRDKETSISHVYDLEDDLGMEYGDDETVTIEITAEVLDQYGGWEETISYDLTIRYREPYSSSPPGGGGGGAIPTGGDFSTFTRDSSRPVQYISTDEATGLLEEKDIWLLSHNEAIYLVDETEDETEFYLVD